MDTLKRLCGITDADSDVQPDTTATKAYRTLTAVMASFGVTVNRGRGAQMYVIGTDGRTQHQICVASGGHSPTEHYYPYSIATWCSINGAQLNNKDNEVFVLSVEDPDYVPHFLIFTRKEMLTTILPEKWRSSSKGGKNDDSESRPLPDHWEKTFFYPRQLQARGHDFVDIRGLVHLTDLVDCYNRFDKLIF